MLSNDDVLSKTIMFLRFPLIVAVVFIHTNLTDVMINGTLLADEGQFPVHDVFRHVMTNELARIAVPLFFFIAGFLFFYHSECYQIKDPTTVEDCFPGNKIFVGTE